MVRPGVGEQIGAYVLTRFLGEGGIAEVWAARHATLAVPVALKILRVRSASQQLRMLREGQVQAGMSHPNILPVRDMLDIDGQPGLVLPLVEGPSLRQLLKHTRLTEPQAAALFRGIAAGVRHAHGLGLVHRDLKPENVLLEPRWGRIIPRVCDFGLVKMLAGADTLTATGAMMGTLNYMAPEQLRDAARVDHRADLFSLGVVLVELLTGRRPYGASSFYTLLQAYQQPPQLDGLPARWGPLVRALLAPDPADRLENSAALAAWLDELAPADDDSLRVDGPLGLRVQDAAHQTDAASSMPSTLSLSGAGLGPPHNLSPEPDAFIGREAALAELAALVAGGARLITLLGVGGIGKTRLAQRFARTQLASCPGGVWFCDLSDVRAREGIVYALARTLSISVNRSNPVQALGRALGHYGRCIIVLDNTEQLVSAVVSLLREWRALAPEVLFLVTSRAVLGAPGEQLLALEPLGPTEARALFLSRARTLKPDFAPQGADEDAAIDALMVLLDGMPLAIELAAARVRIMRPRRMIQRMSERFRLLGDRQRSLQATIDWSWELLSDGEKATLAQCSLFEGGFSLEAAEETADLSALPEVPWVMDVVQSLVDKSLLRARHTHDALRLDTFLSIRAYAAEKLVSPGAFPGAGPALAAAGRRRHAAHYFSLISATPSQVAESRDDLSVLALEASNFSAACRRGIADALPEIVTHAYVILSRLFMARGPLAAGVPLGEAALEAPGLSSAQRVRVQNALALLCYKSGRVADAEGHWSASLSLARQIQDASLIASTCADLSELYRHGEEREKARQLIEEGFAIAQQLGDRRLLILCTYSLGRIHPDPQEARRLLQRALALAQQGHTPFLEQSIQIALGDWSRRRGKLDAAGQAFEAALALARRLGQQHAEGVALVNLGTIRQRSNRHSEARDCYAAALEIARRLGSQRSIATNLHNLASIHLHLGELGAAEAMYREAYQAAEASNVLTILIASSNALGTLATQHGDIVAARGHFGASLARSEMLESTWVAAQPLAKLTALALRVGELDEARRLGERGMALVREAGRLDGQLAFADLQLRIALASGQADEISRLERDMAQVRALLQPAHAGQILKANARMLGELG